MGIYHFEYPPVGTFRKRLCGCCVEDLRDNGYLAEPEAGPPKMIPCERCGGKSMTKVYRYTLSARERAKRGLD